MSPYDVGFPRYAFDSMAIIDLGIRLKNNDHEGLGVLVYLWGWCSCFNRSGVIRSADAKSVSFYLPFRLQGTRRGERIAQALIDSGWLEPHPDGLRIVPWQERTPSWISESHPVSRALAELQEPSAPKEWSRAQLSDVYARDGRVCRYCGTSQGQFSVDHITPRSQGGGDDIDNLAVCCRSCNSRKGARTPAQAGMVLRPVPGVGQ